jgi:hypothetical protein
MGRGIGRKGKERAEDLKERDDPESVNGMHCGSDVNQSGINLWYSWKSMVVLVDI